MIFIPGFYTEVGQIAIQARDLGMTVPLVGGDGWDSPKVIEIGGKAIEGSLLLRSLLRRRAASGRAEVRRRIRRSATARNPEATAALGYDALHILADATKRAGSLDRKAIRDQIAAHEGLPGRLRHHHHGPRPQSDQARGHDQDRKRQMNFAGWVKP